MTYKDYKDKDLEAMKEVQSFADSYPISDYFDSGFYCFSKDELAHLLFSLWSKSKKHTLEGVYKMIENG